MKSKILSQLSDNYPWQDKLRYFPEIDSTNTRLKAMAAQGAPEGTVLIADCQTGGRGRLGRSFLSPPGQGIYMSMLLRPECAPDQLMHLTCAAAVAMCDAVEQAVGFRPGIKWTNDLVFERHKLAGILTEMSLSAAGRVAYAVVGIGINCCQTAADFPPELQQTAGSLSMFAGQPVDRARVAAAMMDALYRMHKELFCGKQQMLRRYRSDCITLGQAISIVRGSDVSHAIARDIDDDGGLLVELPDGTLETVSSGEVSIRGMYGYV